tara:strand:- start:355 stop:555 length:201 start_codon:yes stop_codon:yes gene_type:complete
MNIGKLAENHLPWQDNRSEREKHDDYMYHKYLQEKKSWGETEVFTKAEYLKHNQLFLDANFADWSA